MSQDRAPEWSIVISQVQQLHKCACSFLQYQHRVTNACPFLAVTLSGLTSWMVQWLRCGYIHITISISVTNVSLLVIFLLSPYLLQLWQWFKHLRLSTHRETETQREREICTEKNIQNGHFSDIQRMASLSAKFNTVTKPEARMLNK